MGRLLVLGRVGGGAVNFDQHEAGGVIPLVDHVEAGDAGLLYAVARVLQRCFLEDFDEL